MKSAFITGGSKGIGFAVAEGLALEGYNIAIASRSSTDLEIARQKLSSLNSSISILTHTCDVSKEEDVSSALSLATKSFTHIDLVFNNAGIFNGGTTDLSVEHFDELIAINLRGACLWY